MSECVTFPTDRPPLEGSVPFSLDQGLLLWGGGVAGNQVAAPSLAQLVTWQKRQSGFHFSNIPAP